MPNTRPRTPVSIRVEQLRHGGGLDGLPFAVAYFPLATAHGLFVFHGTAFAVMSLVPGPVVRFRIPNSDLISILSGDGMLIKAALGWGVFILVGFVLRRLALVVLQRRQRVGMPVLVPDRKSMHRTIKLHRIFESKRVILVLFASASLVVTSGVLYEPTRFAATLLAMFVTNYGAIVCFGLHLYSRRTIPPNNRVVCKKCDYPISSYRGAGDKCPECGGLWKKPWALRFGTRRPWVPLIPLGIVLLLIFWSIQFVVTWRLMHGP